MGFKSIALAATTLVLSTSVNADIISYNAYSLDTGTNIVTGGGLEWLQWDETVGLSIDTALSTYGSQGWRLANTVEMASLFNSFALGMTFTDAQGAIQSYERYVPLDPENDFNKFISLFGDTLTPHPLTIDGATSALFGNYPDADLLYNAVGIIAYNNTADFVYAKSYLFGDYTQKSTSISNVGVALVCDSGSCSSLPPSPVPDPAAVWLFGSGLLGLIGVARRKA
jgi:hypothetical protein